MSESSDVVPPFSASSAPFWDGCRRGELRVQRCTDCGRHQFYPRPHCTGCGRADPEWVTAAGLGTVTAFTRVHVPLDESWAGETPYWVALVRLDEGPTLMTNLINTDAAYVGMPVRVRFRARADGTMLPSFAPTADQAAEPEDRS